MSTLWRLLGLTHYSQNQSVQQYSNRGLLSSYPLVPWHKRGTFV